MKRHAKENENVRCCWVCGKEGGLGFTRALDNAGYEVARRPEGGYAEIGYAHPNCMKRALKRAAAKEAALRERKLLEVIRK